MVIFVVNKTTEMVQLYTHGAKYSCPMKEQDGELFFRFNSIWYPVNKYIDNNTKYLGQEVYMTSTEALAQIKNVIADYITDTDHWADYFMEQIVDIVNAYEGGNK